MKEEFREKKPDLFYKKKNGKETLIPYDWTLYYLRKKALTKEITKEELAWITLSFNQKRGYEKIIGQDEKIQKEGELFETFIGKVKSVTENGEKDGLRLFEIALADENDNEIYIYKEESLSQITEIGDLKEFEKVSKYDDEGNINEKDTSYTVKEIRKIKITDVSNATDEKGNFKKIKENFVFNVTLATGWIKEQQSKYLPKWKETERDFIIKTNYNKDGNRILKGQDKGRNINAPKEEDWTLLKLKTETLLSSFNTKNRTVGVASYIYNELLKNPNQKIKGDLVTVIERKYYREELKKIFECQKQFHSELDNSELYQKAIHLLYPNNENRRNTLKDLDFATLIADDVILYQRDLKSKKSLITDCTYEKENFKRIDKKAGKEFQQPLKAVHKANPLYQEFRIWQLIKRLKIFQLSGKENDEVVVNKDISATILTPTIKEKLFEALNSSESVTQKQLFAIYNKIKEKEEEKLTEETHKWNFVIYTDAEKKNEHKEPCNETRYNFIVRLKRIKGFDWKAFLTTENEYRIWHFFYSVKNQIEFKKGINSLFGKLLAESKISIDYKDDLVKNFISFGGYKNDYGTYSEKALKKILPFLRMGKYWSKEAVENILKNTTHEVKEKILSKEEINGEIEDFQGLWISSACYLVYNRYSEVGDLQYWHTPEAIDNFIKNEFKQHSLNNPVVEKVLIETLQLVKDIWKYFGKKDAFGVYQKLFDRIHIELGREMKKNAKERDRESKRNNENKKTNERIIGLLKELKKDNDDIRTKSPFQQERLRILEDDLLSSIDYDKDATTYKLSNGNITKKEIKEITSKDISKISKSDFDRYKLWLDQRYQSPYTGKFIKLSDLFDRAKYEIEHIFPQERITLNAMYNKVICETEVNKAKRASTGYQFIIDCKGTRKIKCAAHRNEEEGVGILDTYKYEELVKSNFTDKKKQDILLSKDIPDQFTNSQLNNARYISKIAMKLLGNVVREEGENDDDYCSKNVLPVTGVITTKLKQDWQLNDAWNELIQPRFERLNKITNSNLFGRIEKVNGHDVFINRVPEELSKDFDKKRIDHRHHAMDALVIALSTRSHVNYLNNISSQDSNEDKLQQRIKLKNKITDTKKNDDGDRSRFFLPPAQYKESSEIVKFTYAYKEDSKPIFKEIVVDALQNIIVSFKQKNRIIKQRTNKYQKWNNEINKLQMISQKNLKLKENYNVRMPLHTSMPYGKKDYEFDILPIIDNLNIREQIIDENVKDKINELFGQFDNKVGIIKKRLKTHPLQDGNGYPILVTTFKIQIEKFRKRIPISKLTERGNTGINNLEGAIKFINKVSDLEIRNDLLKHLIENGNDIDKAFSSDGIKEFNDKRKIIINRLPISEKGEKRFALGESNFTNHKWVEGEAGSNLYCGIYENKSGDRKFVILTLKDTIRKLKNGEKLFEQEITFNDNANDLYSFQFSLSPKDLIYLPYGEELKSKNLVDFEKLSKEQLKRIWVVNDFPSTIYFSPNGFSKAIYPKEIDLSIDQKTGKTKGSFDYKTASFEGIQIKDYCIKLKIDRLGNIFPLEKQQ